MSYIGCQCERRDEYPHYDCVRLDAPDFVKRDFVVIDKCLEHEILHLWSLAIKTTGCCCGHKELLPWVGVRKEYVEKMLELGYIKRTTFDNKGKRSELDIFYPKSIGITSIMADNALNELYEESNK